MNIDQKLIQNNFVLLGDPTGGTVGVVIAVGLIISLAVVAVVYIVRRFRMRNGMLSNFFAMNNKMIHYHYFLTHLDNPLTDFGLIMVINDRIKTSHEFSNQVTD